MGFTEMQKAKIVQFLLQSKSDFVYKITRQSGKTGIVDNLFCLRKRSPDNIVRVEKILKTWHTGNISPKIGEMLNVNNLNGLNHFKGFNDIKNCLEFKSECNWDGYAVMYIPIEKIRKIYKKCTLERINNG